MNRALLKRNAKINFKKQWGNAIVINLILYGIGIVSGLILVPARKGVVNMEDAVAFTSITTIVAAALSFLVLSVFNIGAIRFFQKLRMNVPTGISEIFGNFKDGNYKNIVITFFLKNIKIYLWTFLFIIPGIIKTYEYRLIEYILAVRPDIDRKEAFRLSKLLMDGNKMDAFVLDLSFWGWNILAGYTMGILGIVYVYPYMAATNVEFYAYVRALALQKGLITPMDLPDYEPPFNDGFGYNPQQAFNGAFQNPYQQPFNAGFQQQPDNNPFGYQQTPYEQPQQTPQTTFWQESNQPVGNVETMPNEAPISENEAKEVGFTQVENEEN